SSVIAHDLKTPLGTITGYLELLRDDYGNKLNSEANDLIREVMGGSARIVLHEVLADSKAVIDQKGAEIESGQLPTIHGDKSQMWQLFKNLIGNSMKF